MRLGLRERDEGEEEGERGGAGSRESERDLRPREDLGA